MRSVVLTNPSYATSGTTKGSRIATIHSWLRLTIWHSFGCHPPFGIIRDPPSDQDSICHVRTSPHLLTHRRRGGMHNDAHRFHAQIRAIRIWTYSTACQDDPNPYQIRVHPVIRRSSSHLFSICTLSTMDCFRNGYPNQLSPLLCPPLFVHPTIQGMASPDHDMNGCQPPRPSPNQCTPRCRNSSQYLSLCSSGLTHPTFITPFHKQSACIPSQPSEVPIFDLRPPKFVVGAHEYIKYIIGQTL